MSPAACVLILIYIALALALFVYGSHAYLMTFLYHRHRRIRAGGRALPDPAPLVTVQLPLYNEMYVVRRLIDAVCAFDYPRDRLEIQLLDDSTDETVEAVRRIVAEKRGQGFRIEQVRRGDRVGFKGGALRAGLARARGEFIAVFDADFTPLPDFLARTIPHFADPGLGMVQTRWGHLNEGYSLLTRVQAMALDGHFLIEQTARNRSGAFINFNGTAGVWRRTAIEAAGNWQDDTLTEDLDLSYRAQMAGWRFLFLPDVVCPAELPPEVNSFKGQQFRWAKGSVQTAVKLLPNILRSKNSLFVKFQAVIHLTNHAVYGLLLALAVLTLPALYCHAHLPQFHRLFDWATILIVASLGHPVLYVYSQSRIRPDWRRQLAIVPVMIAMGMGIALNNVRAIWEALWAVPSGFNRTPKYDVKSPGDRWSDKRYRIPVSGLAVAELILGAYTACGAAYSIGHGQYLITPFMVLYSAGFLYVGGMSIGHGLRFSGAASPPARGGSPGPPERGMAPAPAP